MTFAGSTSNDAAFNAWVADNTDETNRGRVNGILSTLPVIAVVIVFVGLGQLYSKENASNWLFFVILGIIPIIAGALEALGIGLVLRYGGSTGGTDIIALMVNRYWPVSLSKAFMVSDLLVVTLLLFLPDKHFSDMVYGIVEIVIFSLMIDFVVGGRKESYQLLVFSSKYEAIADHIVGKMDRGVTVLQATGWYTKTGKNVLLILIGKKELPALTKVIKDVDPRAFMSVSPTSNVYGEGFEEIKAGISHPKKKEKQNKE